MESHFQESLSFFRSNLYNDVQASALFNDSKKFADAIPKAPMAAIFQAYETQRKEKPNFELSAFLEEFFILPTLKEIKANIHDDTIEEHIEQLWTLLQKDKDEPLAGSLIPLSRPYIVPGGRFREIYYWDSYFTALGLVQSGRVSLVEDMLRNLVDLQELVGCIPNGNRTYYATRSQPPILSLMVDLLLPHKKDDHEFLDYAIKAIEAEYCFWMAGSDTLSPSKSTYKRVVLMPDGSVLNRYWDDETTPRAESYKEDVELANQLNDDLRSEFYRNIRAACESGWDFSSRWLKQPDELLSINTTNIIPIDLNCLLYQLELNLARFYKEAGDQESNAKYLDLAKRRKTAINRYLWSETAHFFGDYCIDEQKLSPIKSLATVLPLYTQLANDDQAGHIITLLERDFLKSGGLVTTSINSGQQWDSPNGWAPLHWFAVKGLLHYQYSELAYDIIERWLSTVESSFNQSGKLMEKYDVCHQFNLAKGGEYEVQEGFGWTNGVTQVFYRYLQQKSE